MPLNNSDKIVSIQCLKSQLSSVSIVNGQLIYTTDTQDVYWDVNNSRKQITDIIVLNTEVEKDAILAPLPKFYYVTDSNKLYHYNNGWVIINSGGSLDNLIYVGTNPTGTPSIWVDTGVVPVQVYTVNETERAIALNSLGFYNQEVVKDLTGEYPKYTETTNEYVKVTEKLDADTYRETVTFNDGSKWTRETVKLPNGNFSITVDKRQF